MAVKERKHGTRSMYSAKCRCGPCTKAATKAKNVRVLRMMDGPLKVPALGAIRRLHSLRAFGHPLQEICDEMGVTMGAMSSLLYTTQDRTMVTRTLHDRIDAVYRRRSAYPGSSELTRKRAASQGYAPPAAWDDDALDDPAGVPDGMRAEDGRPRADLDEWWFLVRSGEDPVRAATRIGVQVATLERAAQRAGRTELAAVAANARRRWSA